jgi:hypothetical protein
MYFGQEMQKNNIWDLIRIQVVTEVSMKMSSGMLCHVDWKKFTNISEVTCCLHYHGNE